MCPADPRDRDAQYNIEQMRLKEERARQGTDLRAAMLTENAKALGFINGGGAVALGGLLQAIWPNPLLTYWKAQILWAIGWMAAGVVCAAVQPLLRYFTSFDTRSVILGASPWWWAWLASAIASALCFVIGCFLVVGAGLWSTGRL